MILPGALIMRAPYLFLGERIAISGLVLYYIYSYMSKVTIDVGVTFAQSVIPKRITILLMYPYFLIIVKIILVLLFLWRCEKSIGKFKSRRKSIETRILDAQYIQYPSITVCV